MNETQTPRTDSEEKYVYGRVDRKWTTSDCARTLERELNEANTTNLILQRSQLDLCQERDRLKAELVARTIERDALHGTVMKLILDAEKWRSAWTKEQHE